MTEIRRGSTLDLAVCLKPHLVSSESATTPPPPPDLGLCIVFSPQTFLGRARIALVL